MGHFGTFWDTLPEISHPLRAPRTQRASPARNAASHSKRIILLERCKRFGRSSILLTLRVRMTPGVRHSSSGSCPLVTKLLLRNLLSSKRRFGIHRGGGAAGASKGKHYERSFVTWKLQPCPGSRPRCRLRSYDSHELICQIGHGHDRFVNSLTQAGQVIVISGGRDNAEMRTTFCMQSAKMTMIVRQNDSAVGNRVGKHLWIAQARASRLLNGQYVVTPLTQNENGAEWKVFIRVKTTHDVKVLRLVEWLPRFRRCAVGSSPTPLPSRPAPVRQC